MKTSCVSVKGLLSVSLHDVQVHVDLISPDVLCVHFDTSNTWGLKYNTLIQYPQRYLLDKR